jgi:hypothetical protein
MLTGIMLAVMLLGLPLLGIHLANMPLAPFLEFPPLTQHVEHAPFIWPVFIILLAATGGVLFPFIRANAHARRNLPTPAITPYPFPWWGWLSLAFMALCWFLAWNRFAWFKPLQMHTFTPLWLTYIFSVNALTKKRSGHCMLTDSPLHFALLFAASAAFWWFFEYLNRFVQNWYYIELNGISRLGYFVLATLSFSTVLPAVLGTYDLLKTFPRLSAGLDKLPPIHIRYPKVASIVTLAVSSAGLLGLGIWPDYLYPLLWVSPLLIIVSMQVLLNHDHRLKPIAAGNWRNICLAALAALICGFFWEMWNWHSLSKWIYTVPYVTRFKIFEMPLAGFIGYLPFGLECLVVADWITRRQH